MFCSDAHLLIIKRTTRECKRCVLQVRCICAFKHNKEADNGLYEIDTFCSGAHLLIIKRKIKDCKRCLQQVCCFGAHLNMTEKPITDSTREIIMITY